MKLLKKVLTALVLPLLLILVVTLARPQNSEAAGTNLIANPSVETATNGLPQSWSKDSWGQNTQVFSYLSNGQSGSKSVKVQINSYTSGDAKWNSPRVAVTPNATYTYSDFYKSNIQSFLVIEVEDANGNLSYSDLGSTAASSTNWKQVSVNFVAPANAKKLTVFHLINKVGWLQTDSFSLTQAATATPTPTPTTSPKPTATPTPKPSITPSPTPTTTPSPSATPVPTASPTPSPTITPTPTPSVSPTPTASPTPTPTVTPSPSPTPTPGSNIANNSVEQTANSQTPDNWGKNAWGTNSATFTYLSNLGHTGTHSVKTEITSYSSGDAKWYFNPISVTPGQTVTFSDYYQSNVNSRVVIEYTRTDQSKDYVELKNAPASSGWANYSDNFTVPANTQSMTIYHLISSVGFLITDDYQASQSGASATFSRPLVTLTFDDGLVSQSTTALPTLQKYGLNGTFYIITGVLNTSGYMSTTQVMDLKNSGQEIASHTVTHPHLSQLTDAQMDQELTQSQNFLQANFGVSATNFAPPYGDNDQRISDAVATHYSTLRGVLSGYNTKSNIQFMNLLVQDVTIDTPPSQIQDWVNQAKSTNSWLILVYHAVDNTGDPYGVTPQNFDSEMQMIKQSGVTVETIEQARTEVLSQI